MEETKIPPLSQASEWKRDQAIDKYQTIHPHIALGIPLSVLSKESNVPQGMLQDWVQKYHKYGLKGLIRKKRSDDGIFRVQPELVPIIEEMALRNRKMSMASVHRKK